MADGRNSWIWNLISFILNMFPVSSYQLQGSLFRHNLLKRDSINVVQLLGIFIRAKDMFPLPGNSSLNLYICENFPTSSSLQMLLELFVVVGISCGMQIAKTKVTMVVSFILQCCYHHRFLHHIRRRRPYCRRRHHLLVDMSVVINIKIYKYGT